MTWSQTLPSVEWAGRLPLATLSSPRGRARVEDLVTILPHLGQGLCGTLNRFTRQPVQFREDTVAGLTGEVASGANRPVVLAQRLVQEDAGPIAARAKLCHADILDPPGLDAINENPVTDDKAVRVFGQNFGC